MKSAGRGTEMRLRRYLIRGLLGSAVATTAATCAVDVHSSPPPAPLPPASPDGARPVSTTLHVPSRTNLDRVVTPAAASAVSSIVAHATTPATAPTTG
jgi:hypothetical protein